MLEPGKKGFFVGYLKKVPSDIKRLMISFIAFFLTGMASASLLVTLTIESPGSSRFDDELHGERLIGTMEIKPYPILRVPADGNRPVRAIMLAGSGKFGVADIASPLAGKAVQAGGMFVKRGDLGMLLIGGDADLVSANPQINLQPAAKPENLGRWRLTGEICDGKCGAGAMKPGTGLAHKACANLCIDGGVPPVFVSTAPVQGHIFLLLAAKDGGPMPASLLDKTGLRIALEGIVERRDDLLIFKVADAVDGEAT